MNAFPKIFAIGTDYIRDIFMNEVEITEKVDGSQFGFGKINGELITRSKGKVQYEGAVDKMFTVAVDYVHSIQDKLPEDTFFYAEYLKTPAHNVLGYERTPKNNLILFGVCDPSLKFISKHEELQKYADMLEIEVVPLLFRGVVKNIDDITQLLEADSVLGKVKIEGFVVKNYEKPFLLGGQPIPLMAGKYVSEKFKEVHRNNWKVANTSKGNWGTYIENFRTEARWHKAVQHLRDDGKLTESPKDIGNLMAEVQRDITEESKELIMEYLWKVFGRELLQKSVAGFPEWYKTELMKKSNFSDQDNADNR